MGLRTAGTLAVVVDSADREDLGRIVEHLRAWGRDAERLTGRETRRREPSLGPAVRAGLAVDDDLAVDNRLLLAALHAAAERAGVIVRTEPVLRVTESAARCAGVELASGSATRRRAGLSRPALVGVAAPGAGRAGPSGQGRDPAGSRPRRVAAAADADRARGRRRPRGLRVPRDGGRLVLGATQYEAGFDADVTVGGVRDLLADTERVLPGIADYAARGVGRVVPAGTADNLPVLGAVPGGPDGLLACFGHGRNGILLTALTADVVAALLARSSDARRVGRRPPRRRLATLEVSS